MTITNELPFADALGADAEKLAPLVRRHFVQPPGTSRYRGTMSYIGAIGAHGPIVRFVLRLCSRSGMLTSKSGANVPFELHNEVIVEEGRIDSYWKRSFEFAEGMERFIGRIVHDRARGVMIDWLGTKERIEVELHPHVVDGAIEIRSGRQWLCIAGLRLRIPHLLAGYATIREWERSDGTLGISLRVRSALVGDFFGYDGVFAEESDGEEKK